MYQVNLVATPTTVEVALKKLITAHRTPFLRAHSGNIGFLSMITAGYILLLERGRLQGHIPIIIGIFLVIIFARMFRTSERARISASTRALQLEQVLQAGQIQQVDAQLDDRHWFVEHEHGVIALLPVGDTQTLYLDFSSIADDERFEIWWQQGRIFCKNWRWYRVLADNGSQLADLSFEASGESFAPRRFEQMAGSYDPNVGLDLFEWLDSPGDGDLVNKPFAEVEAYLSGKVQGS
jgi:hypothetical protein